MAVLHSGRGASMSPLPLIFQLPVHHSHQCAKELFTLVYKIIILPPKVNDMGLISVCKYGKNSVEKKRNIKVSWYWVPVYTLPRSQIMLGLGLVSILRQWIIYKECSR